MCADCVLCAVPYGNHGCSGGTAENAFMYIINNGGVDLSKYYPFKGRVREPKDSEKLLFPIMARWCMYQSSLASRLLLYTYIHMHSICI